MSTLPSSLSYNTLSIPLVSQTRSIPHQPDINGTITILRRSLFDVIAQLKAEADVYPRSDPPGLGLDSKLTISSNKINTKSQLNGSKGEIGETTDYDNEALISTLESGDDLRSRIYEGGFKTWECGVDLASYLASHLYLDGQSQDGLGDPDLERWLRDLGLGGEIGDSGAEMGRREYREGGTEEDDGGFDFIELGAGSAIPSLVLLKHVFSRREERRRGRSTLKELVVSHAEEELDRAGRGDTLRFILCDYNIEVLRLLTGANVLLQLGLRDLTHNRILDFSTAEDIDGQGEIDITLDLLRQAVLPYVEEAGISIEFISGAWGEEFVDLILPPIPSLTTTTTNTTTASYTSTPTITASNPNNHHHSNTQASRPILILSSETLYSPSSLQPFVSTLLSLLRRSQSNTSTTATTTPTSASAAKHPRSMALIAAKKIYFGVGGGVDDFILEVQSKGGVVEVARDINGSRHGANGRGGGGGGVGRVILKVTLPEQ